MKIERSFIVGASLSPVRDPRPNHATAFRKCHPSPPTPLPQGARGHEGVSRLEAPGGARRGRKPTSGPPCGGKCRAVALPREGAARRRNVGGRGRPPFCP